MQVQFSRTPQVCTYVQAMNFCESLSSVIGAGEIMCTIHSQVLEEYHRELQPGAVLVLRQVLCIRSLYVLHVLRAMLHVNITRIQGFIWDNFLINIHSTKYLLL